MPELGSHHQVEIGSERNFGLVFTAVFAFVGLAPIASGHDPFRWWALMIAACFLSFALLRPRWLAPLNRLWFRFGRSLNMIVSPLIMGLFFFVVVTPIALVARAIGKDFLRIGRKTKQRESFWIARESDAEHPPSMRNQF